MRIAAGIVSCLTRMIEWNKMYITGTDGLMIEVKIAFVCASFQKTGWMLAVVDMPGLFFCFILPKHKPPIPAIYH
jgi:hypothetical protein